jgi:hypothetical protein
MAFDEVGAWDKLRRLAEKHRASDDPDISKALEAALVAEAQELAPKATAKPSWLAEFPLVAGFFASLPVEAAPSISHTSLEPTAQDPPGDPQSKILSEEPLPNDVETAERLIREAHLFTIRGDKARAKELLDQAEKAAPRSGAVLAALGEAALERHNIKEAVRLLTLAKEAEPGNVAIEKKHADAVFRQTQGMLFDPAARQTSSFENVASAKAAVVLSFLLPGLGQIVTGERGKGATIMAAWVGCLIAIYLIGFQGLLAAVGMGPSKDANMAGFLPLALGVMLHLYAIFDAAGKAKSMEQRKIIRPTPPSDLPFE